MERFKQLLVKHFEILLLAVVALSIVAIHLWIPRKDAFLNFYFLPVLFSGFYLGKRQAIATSVLSILAVVVLVVLTPASFQAGKSLLYTYLDLISWGAFMFLAAVVVGSLFEARERQLEDLRAAYVGIVEILSKYLESTDRYTQGHSMRVANLATDIAIAMGLTRREVENVRTGALLHDIGKVEISGELIRKAAELTTEEKQEVSTHTEKGAEILQAVGSVLQDAVPLVLHHHTSYEHTKGEDGHATQEETPLGAHIIGVADAYDAMVTDRPYRRGRPPWEAFDEIERNTPNQFRPNVVEALRRVMSSIHEEKEALV